MIYKQYTSILRRPTKRRGAPMGRLLMTLRLILGIILGAAAGFAYYKFVGCSSGACPITSNPFISTIYGGIMGAAVSGMFVH